jgi:hypothetical protein
LPLGARQLDTRPLRDRTASGENWGNLAIRHGISYGFEARPVPDHPHRRDFRQGEKIQAVR